MTSLHLIRHGPTHSKAMIGWTDLPADLSDVEALARLSARLPPVPVLTSDLRRATATADALTPTRPRLSPDPRLREIHFGTWEHRTHAEVDAEEPALLRAFWENAGEACAPGGESWNRMATRVLAALDEGLARHPGGLIVVAHFGPILAAAQRALRVDVQTVFAHRIEPLSLTQIEAGPDGWRLVAINQPA